MADDTLDELQRLRQDRVRLGGPSADDTYGTAAPDRGAYVDSLDVGDAPMEEEEYRGAEAAVARRLASYTAPKSVLDEVPRGQVDDAEQARAFPALAPLQRRFPPLLGLGLVSPHSAHASDAPTSSQAFGASRRIVDREDDYRKRRLNRTLSPERADATRLVRALCPLSGHACPAHVSCLRL